jgi:hypothetical protein
MLLLASWSNDALHMCVHTHSVKPPKVKNISASSLGDKVGRIHMKKQNLDKMDARRVSALTGRGKRSAPSGGDENVGADGSSGQSKAKKRPRSV